MKKKVPEGPELSSRPHFVLHRTTIWRQPGLSTGFVDFFLIFVLKRVRHKKRPRNRSSQAELKNKISSAMVLFYSPLTIVDMYKKVQKHKFVQKKEGIFRFPQRCFLHKFTVHPSCVLLGFLLFIHYQVSFQLNFCRRESIANNWSDKFCNQNMWL